MINEDEELALGYLLDPAFELTNTAGKPLTDGWINVYVHGTRNKYYCYSDWNGNLHPFNIPLDGLGSNIVLASPQFTYDVYVYNKYGTLQMSRYNVSPVGVGEVSVSGINDITSSDGTVEVSQYGDTFDLSVPDITAVSGLVEDVAELASAVSSIQVDYVTEEELSSAISAVSAMVPEAQVQSDWNESDPSSKAFILNKPEEKDLVAGDGIEITVSGTSVIISSDNPTVSGYVTEQELASVSGVLQLEIDTVSANPRVKVITYGTDTWADVVAAMDGIHSGKYDYVVAKYSANDTELYAPLVRYVPGSSAYFVCPFQGTDSTYGYGERRTTEVFIINSSGTWSDRTVRPFQGRLIGRGNVSVTVQGEDYIVSGAGGTFEQVNSDWDAVSGVAEILNKPEEIGLYAGNNITITTTGASATINAVVPDVSNFATETELAAVSGNIVSLIPADKVYIFHDYDFNYDAVKTAWTNHKVVQMWIDNPPYNCFLTKVEMPDADTEVFHFTAITPTYNPNGVYAPEWSLFESQVVYTISTGIRSTYGTTKTITDPVKSDWNAVSGLAQILNKPDLSIYETVADAAAVSGNIVSLIPEVVITPSLASGTKIADYSIDGVSGQLFAPNGGGSTYTAGDYIDITDDTISVTGITDLVAGNAITITSSGSSAIISSTGEAQVQSDWDVTDTSSKAYIRNKPQIPDAQVQSDWAEESPYNVAYIRNKPEIHSYTGASGISISNDVVSLDEPLGLVAGNNVDITVSGVSAIISCTGSGGGSDVQITPVVSSGTKIAEFTVDGVSGELYAPQGGSSYTAGDNIDITNDVISVTGTGELLAGANITIAPSGSDYVISSTGGDGGTSYSAGNMISLADDTISVSTTAGITDIQQVSALPASPVSSVLYLIPEA